MSPPDALQKLMPGRKGHLRPFRKQTTPHLDNSSNSLLVCKTWARGVAEQDATYDSEVVGLRHLTEVEACDAQSKVIVKNVEQECAVLSMSVQIAVNLLYANRLSTHEGSLNAP